MADDYDLLSDGEKAHWDEYTRLREISDNAGFDDQQKQRKTDSRAWLDERRAYIKNLAEGKVPGEKPGWDVSNRRERYDMLAPDRLNGGSPRRQAKLPKTNGTDNEVVYIREREMWWQVDSTTDAQKARKIACTTWLENRRKYVWRQAEGSIESDAGPGWDKKHREQRYDNLCVATKYGSAYEAWKKDHNDYTGESTGGGSGGSGSGSWRDKAKSWHNDHLGITEDPPNSNCDNRKDGIRNAQDTCANGTWLRNQPWCGVWAFMGLYAAGKARSGSESWMASVASIEENAKAGRYPFKGWTTDGSKAKTGDLVVLFGYGVHVGTVRETPTGSTCPTWEGNTSSSSGGSQSNGGGSYKRDRSRSSEVRGYALVDG